MSQNNNRQLQARPNRKTEQTFDFFKNTKVLTCSYIKRKGDDFIAVPFYFKPNQRNPDYLNKSMYSTSTNHDAYNNKKRCFSSMRNKPLSPYNPLAHRSRLADQSLRISSSNMCQIEIGDRNQRMIKHYVTQYKNQLGNFGETTPCSNPQIMAERAKWNHRLKDK
ncbi:unnamed protein product [Paramecium primaurelia]|uniref:Uncharacterized protein n=2 Tax=Paramecium TaxID=5884 RepID=A0A8S1U1K5_9CILI|nr:unnamed protein product [Paramecium primaurelia]CAD8157507.1 unnamed protein product [Paramecium pentaurelia]